MVKVLERSIGGAALLLASTVGQRILTFVLNALITRAAGATVLGFASNDMELLLATILFLTREPFRLAGLRCSPSSGRQAQSLVNMSWAPVYIGSFAVAVAIVVIAWGAASDADSGTPPTDITINLYSVELSAPMQRSVTAALFVVGAWFELLAEPMYILTQSELMYDLRVRAEGLGILAKSGLAYVLVVHSGLGPLAFGLAQLAYGIAVLTTFAAFFLGDGGDRLESIRVLRNSQPNSLKVLAGVPLPARLGTLARTEVATASDETSMQESKPKGSDHPSAGNTNLSKNNGASNVATTKERLSPLAAKSKSDTADRNDRPAGEDEDECKESRQPGGSRKSDSAHAASWVLALSFMWAPWVEASDAGLVGALALEGVAKHLITQGDRIVLLASAGEDTKGLWAVVSSYGSLAPRLLFQSLEEAARGLFGRLASETRTQSSQSTASSQPSNGTAARAGTEVYGTTSDEQYDDMDAGTDSNERKEQAVAGAGKDRMAGALELVMWSVSLVGLLFVTIGSSYTELATNVILGPRFPHSGTLLAYYCIYVFLMAVNGALESFVHAVASHGYIVKLAWQMTLASGIFAAASTLALQSGGGIVGVVFANCLATAVRIGFALAYVNWWFDARPLTDSIGAETESAAVCTKRDNSNHVPLESSKGHSLPLGKVSERSGSLTSGRKNSRDFTAKKRGRYAQQQGLTASVGPSIARLLPSIPSLLAIGAAFATTHASWVWYREPDPWGLPSESNETAAASFSLREREQLQSSEAAVQLPFGVIDSPARQLLSTIFDSGMQSLPAPPAGCGCSLYSGCIVPWMDDGPVGVGSGGKAITRMPDYSAHPSWWGCRLRHLATGAGAGLLVLVSLFVFDRDRIESSVLALREGRRAARSG